MLSNFSRTAARFFSTSRAVAAAASSESSPAATQYPFSKTALILPASKSTDALRAGRGLMQHLQRSLFTPEKLKMFNTLFSRKSPMCLQPGSIISITSEQAPTSFTGVLIGIRRRGPDTSFRVRNILQRTGVEMQFFVNSPTLKEIKLVKSPPKGRMRRAKLYYLRDSPDKMSMLAGGKN